MKSYLLKGQSKSSHIIIGAAEPYLRKAADGKQLIMVCDENLNRLYPDFLKDVPRIVIEPGEEHKNWQTIEYIISEMLQLSADRNTFLLGFGGGVVGDLTGFVASSFMRGISFGLIPTSLLAQSDAAIGGKTGFNFRGYKNIVGAFYLADFVLCDTSFLKTLAPEEYLSGLGELIKYGLIADKKMYRYIYENSQDILAQKSECLNYLIETAVRIKVEVVNEDELEMGRRKILNLGHTLGHAIEKHKRIAHGFAVNIGTLLALKISEQQGLIPLSEIDYFLELSKKLSLPYTHNIAVDSLWQAMKKDKKKQNETLDFVLLEAIGQAKIHRFTYTEIKALMDELC